MLSVRARIGLSVWLEKLEKPLFWAGKAGQILKDNKSARIFAFYYLQ